MGLLAGLLGGFSLSQVAEAGVAIPGAAFSEAAPLRSPAIFAGEPALALDLSLAVDAAADSRDRKSVQSADRRSKSDDDSPRLFSIDLTAASFARGGMNSQGMTGSPVGMGGSLAGLPAPVLAILQGQVDLLTYHGRVLPLRLEAPGPYSSSSGSAGGAGSVGAGPGGSSSSALAAASIVPPPAPLSARRCGERRLSLPPPPIFGLLRPPQALAGL